MRSKTFIQKTYLIVGLGNPGLGYERTRHNVGFKILDTYLEKKRVSFKEERRFLGWTSSILSDEKKVIFLKPATYMNLSGESVIKVLSYYKVPHDQVLVITDDVAIPFGELRLRAFGSSGGHNGLESVKKHLGSSQFARLRVGVGSPGVKALDEYVLERFSSNESPELPGIFEKAHVAIDLWLLKGTEAAMNVVNRKPNEKKSLAEELNNSPENG